MTSILKVVSGEMIYLNRGKEGSVLKKAIAKKKTGRTRPAVPYKATLIAIRSSKKLYQLIEECVVSIDSPTRVDEHCSKIEDGSRRDKASAAHSSRVRTARRRCSTAGKHRRGS